MIDIHANEVRNEKRWLVINVGCCGAGYPNSGGEWPAAEESSADRISRATDPAGESTRAEAIRLALRELGYIEGQNIATEYRYAQGKRDRSLTCGRVGAPQGRYHCGSRREPADPGGHECEQDYSHCHGWPWRRSCRVRLR